MVFALVLIITLVAMIAFPIYRHKQAKDKGIHSFKRGMITALLTFAIFFFGISIAGMTEGNDSESEPKTHKQQVVRKSKENTKKPSKKASTKIPKKVSDESSSSSKSTTKHKIPMEYKNALITAQEYNETTPMSETGLLEQLTSSDGEGFTQDAAQYAIKHLNANWNQNALKCAKEYEKTDHLSRAELRDQLGSDSGEKFTPSQVEYAMSHLDN